MRLSRALCRIFILSVCAWCIIYSTELVAATRAMSRWHVDERKSRLEFIGREGGKKFRGRFTQFSADIDFDPLQPETGNVLVRIRMNKVKIDGKKRQNAIADSTWFDSVDFPEAVFQSTAFKRIDATHFVAEGNLTIKSITHPLTLPFTFTQKDGVARVAAKVTINRRDWNVGTGDFKSEAWVAHAVTIQLKLHATRLKH